MAIDTIKNRVQLIGTVGSAPESIKTDSGKKFIRFSIATNETYNNIHGERVKETQWHKIIVWNKLVEVVEKFISSGTEVALEGKLITRSYTDEKGYKHSVTEIQASEILILGSAKNNQNV